MLYVLTTLVVMFYALTTLVVLWHVASIITMMLDQYLWRRRHRRYTQWLEYHLPRLPEYTHDKQMAVLNELLKYIGNANPDVRGPWEKDVTWVPPLVKK